MEVAYILLLVEELRRALLARVVLFSEEREEGIPEGSQNNLTMVQTVEEKPAG